MEDKSWTEEENRLLRENAGKQSVQWIADKLGRGYGAVRAYAHRFGISLAIHNFPWTEEDDRLLKENVGKQRLQWLVEKLQRTRGSLHHRLYVLGLSLLPIDARCPDCGKKLKHWAKDGRCNRCSTSKRHRDNPELQSVRGHFGSICRDSAGRYPTYKGMPFFDGWNPDKGGSHQVGADWIIANLGNRPKGSTLHIVDHEKGFVPGNLEWTHPRKQSNQQMFKIIAQQRHRIKELEAEVALLKAA